MEKKFPTIGEKLKQIHEFGLPYQARPKNKIPKSYEIVDYLERDTPEVVISHKKSPFKRNFLYPLMQYTSAFHKCTNGLVEAIRVIDEHGRRVNTGIDIIDRKRDLIPIENLEVHAFYDTNTNMTHYFIMPSRKLINNYKLINKLSETENGKEK